MPALMFPLFTPLCVAADAPKVRGSVAVYTWEGNPANISCGVEAHPGASVLWFRDGLQLPVANSTNIKIYNTPTISYLEVCCTFLTYKKTGVYRPQQGCLCNKLNALCFGRVCQILLEFASATAIAVDKGQLWKAILNSFCSTDRRFELLVL